MGALMKKSTVSKAAACILLLALLVPPLAHAATTTLITAAVSAGTTPGNTTITPLDIKTTTLTNATSADAVVLGPQSLLLKLVNSYPTSYTLDIRVTLTNATFAAVDSAAFYSLDSTGALK